MNVKEQLLRMGGIHAERHSMCGAFWILGPFKLLNMVQSRAFTFCYELETHPCLYWLEALGPSHVSPLLFFTETVCI